jgi:hypothetical protein
MTTLDDLKSRFELYAVCIACRRMEKLDIPALIETFGGSYPVADVRARVRCKQCGLRTGDIRIAYGSGGFHYRGPTRRSER